MSVPAALKFTYEDYALLPEDRRYEVIDGELFVTPAPTTLHQLAKRRLVRILEDFSEATGTGSILDAPYDVVLSKHDVVQPDALLVTTARKPIIGEKNIQGAPDLVVEVLSPSTETRDRRAKAEALCDLRGPRNVARGPGRKDHRGIGQHAGGFPPRGALR